MTLITNDDNWAVRAEVFLGAIYALNTDTATEDALNAPGQPVSLTLFRDNDGDVIIGQSDWLIAGEEQPASVFRFLYQSSTTNSNRLQFMITGSGTDNDKTVGVSRNGYLGLYKVANVSEPLRIEPLHWSENAVVCRLRDHQGFSVRTYHDSAVANPNFSYLRIGEGKEVIFRIERVTP